MALFLFITNPWIEITVQDIDHKVDDDDHECNEQDNTLDDGEVPLPNGFKDEPPDAGKMKLISFNCVWVCSASLERVGPITAPVRPRIIKVA